MATVSDLRPTISGGGSFLRHRGPVTCAAAVPNRDVLVTSSYDCAVALVDEAGAFNLLGYHNHLVNRIVVSLDGRIAASPSSDYTIGLWDLDRRVSLGRLIGHSDDVEDFVFADNGRGVSVSRDHRAIVWDLESHAPLAILEGHEKDVLSVAYASGRVFTSGDDMTLRVWNIDTGDLERTWGPFEHETDSCAIDAVRGRVFLGCDDGIIRVFDIASGEVIAEIPAHQSGIKVVTVSPESGDVFSAAYDRRLLVWDADTYELKTELDPMATVWERSFNWSPDGQRIVAGTFDGTVAVWRSSDGTQLLEYDGGDRSGNPCFNEVAASEDLIAAVADDGYLRFGRISATGGLWIAKVEPVGGRVLANAVTISSDATRVITGSHDQTVRIYDCGDTLDEVAAVNLHEGPINAVRIASQGDGGDVYVACYSGSVVRLTSAGRVVDRYAVHDGAVKSLALAVDKGIGVSCAADGSVHIWGLADGEIQHDVPGHTAIVNDIAISDDAKRFATVGRDFLLNVYELDDGRLVKAIKTGSHSPKSLVFFGDQVFIGDYWGNLVRANLATGEVRRARIAANGISSLDVSCDGVIASSYDGAIYFVDPERLRVETELREMTQRT